MMCSFENSLTLILPYFAFSQSIYLAILNPLESTSRVPWTASSPAILVMIFCSTAGSIVGIISNRTNFSCGV